MKGCKALKPEEVHSINEVLLPKRDKCLFILGVTTGFRISELLSLKVKSVFENGKVSQRANLEKRNTKGKIEGRSAILNPRAQQAILELIQEQKLEADDFIFGSRKGGAISRKQAWRILKSAFKVAEIDGKTGTHSMRKTLAQNVYKASGKDILKTQKALGHKSLNSTTSYLTTTQEEVDEVMLTIDAFAVI